MSPPPTGKRPTSTAPPQSDLLSRLSTFLPQLSAANASLDEEIRTNGAESRNIEHVDDGEERYIEMNLGLGVLEEVRDGDSDSEGVEEAGKQDPIAKALNPQGPKPDIQLVDEEPHGTKRRATEDPESSSDEDDEDHEDDENDEDDGEEASEIKTIVAESTRHGKGPKEEAVAA